MRLGALMSFRDELVRRAGEFTQRTGLALADELGFGVHGIVFATQYQATGGQPGIRSAIKVNQREAEYCRERDLDLRLQEHGITSIRGCHVPRLLAHGDVLRMVFPARNMDSTIDLDTR